ncbi:TetR/AcrR family transcriptional regulator [Nocardioides sp. W7]|uniref:TetR/AcrR family transcriptional regulator n=1 Tax=Nocardioides sp. W7 TaxID=2931390 RepID=UPI001FD47457|nr:TetR/AcrR family transcriptional regulator [Nocardioides sp. W7]
MPRRYEMTGRTRAMERTRDAILDAAVELFAPAWYDDVTLADVARAAGVSQQTVVNHFGSKVRLYLAGLAERVGPGIDSARARAVPGDVASVVGVVVEDYEETGDGTARLIATAERLPELAEAVAAGRAAHRAFVATAFAPQLARRRGVARERVLVRLATVLDVTVWKRLRRDEGLSREETAEHLTALVEGVLAD